MIAAPPVFPKLATSTLPASTNAARLVKLLMIRSPAPTAIVGTTVCPFSTAPEASLAWAPWLVACP